jgi:hypothetical protein
MLAAWRCLATWHHFYLLDHVFLPHLVLSNAPLHDEVGEDEGEADHEYQPTYQ